MPFKGNPPKIDEPPQHTDATHSFSLFVREKPILIRGISIGSVIYVVVSSPQCGENTAFFSCFPLGGNHGQGIFPVILLELQGKKHQPFSITQPFNTSFQPVIRMGKPSIILLHVRCGGATCIYAERLCHRKWLTLYFLKFQVNKQRNTAIMQSDNGKLEKKPVFFTMLCRENNLLLFSL